MKSSRLSGLSNCVIFGVSRCSRLPYNYFMIWSSAPKEAFDSSRYKLLPELQQIVAGPKQKQPRLLISQPKRQTLQQKLSQLKIPLQPPNKLAQIYLGTRNTMAGTAKRLQPIRRDPIDFLSKHQIDAINIYKRENLSQKVKKGRQKGRNSQKKIHISTHDLLPSLAQDMILNEWIFAVNLSNSMVVNNRRMFPFRAYFERGNNGFLVKAILNRRWWWHSVDSPEGCNFMWSEWMRVDFMDSMDKNFRIPPHRQLDNGYEESKEERIHSSDTLKKSESIAMKKYTIQKVINLKKFHKLSAKVSKHQDRYFSFSKKLKEGFPTQLAENYLPTQFSSLREVECQYNSRIHNHVEGGLNLHSKKLLLANLKQYYESRNMNPFEHVPLTFHIKDPIQQGEYYDFIRQFDKIASEREMSRTGEFRKSRRQIGKNIWICKPGQNSNRGTGITVVKTKQGIAQQIESINQNPKHTLIVQKYLQNPFLVQGRKFDIRCYILITTYNNVIKGYWYEDGYIRTASQPYTLDDVENQMVHLTNDAVQKKGRNYGKFESCNKMSFREFEIYLDTKTKTPKGKFAKSYQKIKSLARDLVHSVYDKINLQKRQYQFELFGLDFMLDSNLKPWLIEANSNPCLQTSGYILTTLIPALIDNVFRIALDPIFPPPCDPHASKLRMNARVDYFESNKFELIFDSADMKQIKEEDDQTEVLHKMESA